MRGKNIAYFVLGAALVASGFYGVAVGDLLGFKAGDPIKSAEVNQNFNTLKSAVATLEAPIGPARLAISGGAADGKVLKLSGGNLTWSDDIVGSPGTSYTADGSSLSLAGTTFSVKDGGVDTAKLANQSVTGAKLAPNSVAFGLIADGGVPGSKLQMPLNLSGGFGNQAVLKAVDTSSVGGTGVRGESAIAIGVFGKSGNPDFGGIGFDSSAVMGLGQKGGVTGASPAGIGVFGYSSSKYGVYGQSQSNNAVYGVTPGSNTNATAIAGTSDHGYAAYFEAGNGAGGYATCTFHAGTTNWACSSDRNLKANFKPVNSAKILEALAQMPITTWNMKGSKIRQMGPTSQDFYAAFKLGDSDKSINNTDAQGVALAAIKGLYQENQQLQKQVSSLQKLGAQNRDLTRRLGELDKRLQALEQRSGR